MRDPIGGIDYVRAHLEEALATDPRVAEGGLHVAVAGDGLVVSGSVSTPARHRAVSAVASEVAQDFSVRNDTSVVPLREPTGGEAVG
ncbi:MAG: BON domain-containing protein [Acidimicrobiia bacterium]